MAELEELGLVRESGQERPGAVGRPAQNVELDPSGPYVLGLELGVDYLAVWAADLSGVFLHRSFVTSENRDQPERVLSRLELLARQALDEPFAAGRRPVAATLAVPGIVDDHGGLVVAPNLRWEDVPVAQMLSESLGPRDTSRTRRTWARSPSSARARGRACATSSTSPARSASGPAS